MGRVKNPELVDNASDRAVGLRSFGIVTGNRLGEDVGEGRKTLLRNVGSDVKSSTNVEEGGVGSAGI